MSSWVAVLVETRGRADFWEIAKRHDVEAADLAKRPGAAIDRDGGSGASPVVLLDCGHAYGVSFRLAESLSRDLATTALGFAAQTTADVHEARVFREGTLVRGLAYNRDAGGWKEVVGAVQPWERAYFFDEKSSTADDTRWPEMLYDELSEADIARYERAMAAGDPTPVLDLLHPSSLRPMRRVCRFYQIDPDRPAGHWRRPSLWSRLLRR